LSAARVIVRAGREENIELVCCTQTAADVSYSITGQATELVCFHLKEPRDLACIQKRGADPEAVAALPKGSFISRNLESGGRLQGKLF
jgi:hypothetical protein